MHLSIVSLLTECFMSLGTNCHGEEARDGALQAVKSTFPNNVLDFFLATLLTSRCSTPLLLSTERLSTPALQHSDFFPPLWLGGRSWRPADLLMCIAISWWYGCRTPVFVPRV